MGNAAGNCRGGNRCFVDDALMIGLDSLLGGGGLQQSATSGASGGTVGTATDGGSTSANAVANKGGGGGPGRNGGSGVVIIRWLTANAAGLTITGGTQTTTGSYTVATFTSSGTFTIG